MPAFSAVLPLEVLKPWLLSKYKLEDLDNDYILWYNRELKSLVLEPRELSNEPDTAQGSPDYKDDHC